MNIQYPIVSIFETYERNKTKLFNIWKGKKIINIYKFKICKYTSIQLRYALQVSLEPFRRNGGKILNETIL